MSNLKEYAGELMVARCWCGIQHAIPKALKEQQQREHDQGKRMSVYCPLGHSYVLSGDSEATRLQRQLARERAEHDQTRADRDHKERQRRGEKGAKTRARKKLARVKAGVCPCCSRNFQNLARHMAGQHPDFEASE